MVSTALSFCSAYPFFLLTTATKHCLATCWLPLTMVMPFSVGNSTFTCKVDGTALIAWIHGRPRIAVYGENELATMNATITSLPSIFTRREICPLGATTLPSNPTNSVSYFNRSQFFNLSPLNRFGYIISAPLPWSTITLLTKKPLIQAVITNAPSCG